MLLLSYPQNPTGAVVDAEFFQKIVDYARANKLIVVHDFAYAELVDRAEQKVGALAAQQHSCGLPAEPDAAAVDELLRAVTRAWESGRA